MARCRSLRYDPTEAVDPCHRKGRRQRKTREIENDEERWHRRSIVHGSCKLSGMRPPNVTFQVTILILVPHQIRMCAEYIVAFVLILDPQVDGLEVQRLLALTVVVPINGDVWFLLLF